MSKILEINNENPNGVVRDMTPEELAQAETDKQNAITEDAEKETAKTNLENLKASAKAKLIAGEALTEEEANTVVI